MFASKNYIILLSTSTVVHIAIFRGKWQCNNTEQLRSLLCLREVFRTRAVCICNLVIQASLELQKKVYTAYAMLKLCWHSCKDLEDS